MELSIWFRSECCKKKEGRKATRERERWMGGENVFGCKSVFIAIRERGRERWRKHTTDANIGEVA
jgi:hypothetical protein